MSKVYSGVAISPGLALGHLSQCQQRQHAQAICLRDLLGQEAQVLQQLAQREDLSDNQRQLLEADWLLLSDPELLDGIERRQQQGVALAQAIWLEFDQFAAQIAQLPQPELAKRATDLRYLGQRLSRRCSGDQLQFPSQFEQPTVLLLPDLTAAEFIQLPKANLSGLVLEHGSLTDHLAILIRAAAIPAIILADGCSRLSPGPSMLDGDSGQITIANHRDDLLQFDAIQHHWQQRQQHYNLARQQPARTADGHSLWLGGNIGSLDECEAIHANQLDGVGLLRTELLYLASGQWPTEAQQYQHYRAIAARLEGKPLVIRTFDFGADKDLPGLSQPQANPALGLRAIRLGRDHGQHLRDQLRAIIRVAQDHPVQLLLPMVSLVEELHSAKMMIAAEQQALGLLTPLPIGVMIETPAAALMIDQLAPLVDFASIGSNDLAQYCLAADRNNGHVSPHFPDLSPPVIRLIDQIARQCQQQQLPLSICGELGADLRAVPLLLALGISKFSIAPNRAGEVKYLLSHFSYCDAQPLRQKALQCSTNEQLQNLLIGCNAYQKATKMTDSAMSQ
ncbi:phosphoenolpyruvate--protein phosphotransferase [uncultured Ferrimonas sp.]|uniref:phosphoenolpyruvate--protein phosphotransferase n=1 Tax=uncultured Ferrimonas sp. TaxID=432640 RepID=UPI002612FD56|nr:phosphoenolpyruvate--protein phosphotransferase [uncultured Ferrimonas sp.]